MKYKIDNIIPGTVIVALNISIAQSPFQFFNINSLLDSKHKLVSQLDTKHKLISYP